MNNIYFIVLIILVMTVVTLKNDNFALKLCIFLMPYNLNSFKSFFGVNNAVIYGLVIGTLLKYLIMKRRIFVLDKTMKIFFLAFFIVFIISLIIMIFGNIKYSEMYYYSLDVLSTTPFFIANLLTGPFLFLFILKDYQKNKDLNTIILPFLLSFIYFFITWLGFYFNLSLPSFISYKMQGVGYSPRFTGLWGDYELTAELIFIYIIIAFIYYKENNKKIVFPVLIILLSILVGITTRTRSLVMLFTLLLLFSIIYIIFITKITVLLRITIVFVISFFTFITILIIISDSLFASRLNDTLTIIKFLPNFDIETLQRVFNRNYTDTYFDILEVGGLFGIGPILVSTFRGSYMVYHNFYYHITLCFGLVGLLLYSFFVGYIQLKVFFLSIRNKNVIVYLLFSLIFILHIDQMKIDYWRDSPTIQIYWYLFALAYSFIIFYNSPNQIEYCHS